MMIKLCHASVTYAAMLGPQGSHHPAGMAQAQYVRPAIRLPLVVVGDLFDGAVVVVGVLGQESRILLIGHQQADPHDYVHDNEGVMCLGQRLPGDGNTAQKVHGIGPEKDTPDEEQERPFGAAGLAKHQRPNVQEDG